MIVLDTHSWIGWVDGSDRLSPKAKRALDAEAQRSALLVSSISVWELHMLVARGRLTLRTDPAHWVRQCELSPKIRFVPVDNEIARISVQLLGSVPEDPADRIIVATAVSVGGVLVTKSKKIQGSGAVQALW